MHNCKHIYRLYFELTSLSTICLVLREVNFFLLSFQRLPIALT